MPQQLLQKNSSKKLKSSQELTNETISKGISAFRKKNKIAAEEEICFAIGGVIHCDKFKKEKPKNKRISSIPWHLKFMKEEADKFIGPRRRNRQSQKIAQLNIHTKLLSAKLSSIKIGKLLEAKKKQ